MADVSNVLAIQTVKQGYYEGFNAVVSITTKALIVLLVIALILAPVASSDALVSLKSTTLHYFGAWYIYLLGVFVVFCAVLLVLPVSGRIKLGADGDIPAHSTAAWLSMMFCSGIGVGILVFSVSEPISHFTSNPDIMNGAVAVNAPDAVISSLRFVFLHWGISAWGCYAVIGMALGLACHRRGQPMTMRSAVAPLFGRHLEGFAGHVIDIISILAIIAGITTTIVLGLEQICSGLSALTGSPFFADQLGNPPLTALLTALVITVAIAIGSLTSGLDRGIKWTSTLGMALAFAVLGIFASTGPTTALFETFFHTTATYIRTLPIEIFTVHRATPAGDTPQGDWQAEWTIFYWAWWIAFAPFIGLFLARISRGRTLREFILGSVLGPSALCFLWFTVMGGSAIFLELDGIAEGRILDAPHAFRIYETIEVAMAPGLQTLIKACVTLLFLVLIVASSTAAIIAIKSIGASGGELAETPFHSMIWAIVIAAVAGAVMSVGGVSSIRDVMIVGAVPFSVIMALMLISVAKIIAEDWQTPGPRTGNLPVAKIGTDPAT